MEVTVRKHHWDKNQYLDTPWFPRHLTFCSNRFVTPVTLINRKHASCLWWVPYVDIVNTSPRRRHRKPRLESGVLFSLFSLDVKEATSDFFTCHASSTNMPKTSQFAKSANFSGFTVCLIYHNSKDGTFLHTLRKFTFMYTKTISKFRTINLSHYLLTSHIGTPGNHAQFQSIKFKIKWEPCSTHFFPVIT